MSNGTTLVLGLGNPLLGDDGVGWRVAEQVRHALEHTASRAEVDCLSVGGLSLMERMVGYDRVILVDSISTGRQSPGSLYRFSLDSLPDPSAGHLSSAHDVTLQTALKAGAAIGLPLPADVNVVAIEARPGLDFSETLSASVTAAVPLAVQTVLDLLKE